ncbi:peptide/nickel transport system permease protein [Faunimonas pinastri]|uniref:Peptide/nickel transport system permease protein n=1 Tax=Faunimonas pinastri TaxID=1855383 RepID=A0A1H9ICG0_9HYPH|nr:ABC transporter permease [Faunimonas pinastri]SEQ72236.1 peptide/nickel transport system permease protein [Faunimonas pinastri]
MLNLGFVVRRLLQMIPTFVFILVVTFVIVRLLPGDPLSAQAGDRVTDAQVAHAQAELGLDQPMLVQFFLFVKHVLSGDLGRSYVVQIPVWRLIGQRLPPTLILTAMSTILGILIAVPLAFVAALRRDRVSDAAIRGTFQVGLSMPVFYIGLVLLTVFSAQLRWFPVGGYGDSMADHVYHLFLPSLTLAVSLAAVLMRNLRTAIIDVLNAEYVDFARAKGLMPRVIMIRHVLRNALISSVALLGPTIGTLLGGAVITESVFAIPGVGRLMIDSIYGRDYPVIQGLTLSLAVVVSLIFLATDLIQAALDPRVAQ